MADAGNPPSKGQHRTSVDTLDWTVGEGGRFAAFPLGDGDHDAIVVIVEYSPNTEIAPHHHGSDYFSMVLAGDVEVTRRLDEEGSIRHVRATTTYGPLRVGAAGCTVLEVFADRATFIRPVFARATNEPMPTSVSSMPALYAQAIAAAIGRLGGSPAAALEDAPGARSGRSAPRDQEVRP